MIEYFRNKKKLQNTYISPASALGAGHMTQFWGKQVKVEFHTRT